MTATSERIAKARAWPPLVAPVLALVGVNAFAVTGTGQWAYAYLGGNVVTAVAFAAVLESVSLFLTSQANKAMLADLRSAPLRLAAYIMGAGVGTMNYVAHAGPRFSPTVMALAFGMLSASSPWLWTIWARTKHQEALLAAGLIDRRAVHFALVLWMLHPYRTAVATWHATWHGIQDPMEARALLMERAALRRMTPADALRYALAALDTFDTHAARVWLQARGHMIPEAIVAEVRRDLAETTPTRPRPRHESPAAAPVSAAPVSAAPAIAGRLIDPGTDDWHRTRLAECGSKRDAIRYALGHLGPEARPAEVRDWLSPYGITIRRSEVAEVRRPLAVPVSPAPAINGHALALTAPTTR